MHVWPFPISFPRLCCALKKKRKKKTKNRRRKERKEEGKNWKGAKRREYPSMTTLRQLFRVRGGAPPPPLVSETCRDKRRERRLCRKAASRSNYGRTIPVIEFNCSTKEESYLIAPPLCTRRFTINPRRNIRNAINWIVNRLVRCSSLFCSRCREKIARPRRKLLSFSADNFIRLFYCFFFCSFSFFFFGKYINIYIFYELWNWIEIVVFTDYSKLEKLLEFFIITSWQKNLGKSNKR